VKPPSGSHSQDWRSRASRSLWGWEKAVEDQAQAGLPVPSASFPNSKSSSQGRTLTGLRKTKSDVLVHFCNLSTMSLRQGD
jgi:hypothetical protein